MITMTIKYNREQPSSLISINYDTTGIHYEERRINMVFGGGVDGQTEGDAKMITPLFSGAQCSREVVTKRGKVWMNSTWPKLICNPNNYHGIELATITYT